MSSGPILTQRIELGLKVEEEIFENTIGLVDGFIVHDDSEYWRGKKRISF